MSASNWRFCAAEILVTAVTSSIRFDIADTSPVEVSMNVLGFSVAYAGRKYWLRCRYPLLAIS
jgi:hypothetical protein